MKVDSFRLYQNTYLFLISIFHSKSKIKRIVFRINIAAVSVNNLIMQENQCNILLLIVKNSACYHLVLSITPLIDLYAKVLCLLFMLDAPSYEKMDGYLKA